MSDATEVPTDAVEPIAVEALPGEVAADPVATAQAVVMSDVMTKEEFFLFFGGSFVATANVLGAMRPPKLVSLEKAGELPTARPASDAIYDMAARMPWLAWLISRDMAWMQGAVVIFAFGAQLKAAVDAEIASRGAQPAEGQGDGEPQSHPYAAA